MALRAALQALEGDLLLPAPTGVALVDTTMLQAAYSVLLVGETLRARPGTYAVDVQLAPAPYATLSGSGKRVTTIKVVGTNRAFRALNVPGVTISDLTIDLNKAETTDTGATSGQQAVFFQSTNEVGCPGARLERVRVMNGHRRGVHAAATVTDTNPLDLTVLDCDIFGCGSNGLVSQNATKTVAHRNDIYGNGSVGLHVVAGRGADICHNQVHDHLTNHGIVVNTGNEGALVHGNECWGNLGIGNWGIVIGVNAKEFVVTNNRCRGNGGGITIDLADPADLTAWIDAQGVVSGNLCTESTESNGLHVNQGEGLAISGNVCTYNAQTGLEVYGRHCNITGNVCHHNGRYGTSFRQVSVERAAGPHQYVGNMAYANNTVAGAWTDYHSDVLANGAVATGPNF
jgi:hypothetical protein